VSRRSIIAVVVGVLLVASFAAELAESRGARGSRGGGGFSRGGGGFGRPSGGGSFGSIRHSAPPSSWNARPSPSRDLPRSGPSARPSYEQRPSYGQRPEPRPRPDTGFERNRADQAARPDPRPAQRPAAGDRPRAEHQPTRARDTDRQRLKDMTPEQKDQLREKLENSGLEPSQLPSRDEIRDDWQDNREDWQDWRDDAREDWQAWYANMYDEYWDDHWYPVWWYGYPVSTISFSFYIDDTPPCQKTVVINQSTGQMTYYYCDSVWYQPTFAGGEAAYVVSAPPPGGELTTLSNPYHVKVEGQDYWVSNHVFYQKITRNDASTYVTVDAPIGAKLPTIPEYSVAIEHQGLTYYRFDRIFYLQQGDVFVVVANPGV